MTTASLPDGFLARLERELSPDSLLVDESDLVEYGRDRTRMFEPHPSAIALPRTADEVAALVRVCAEARFPVVPSGGRTGLAGGAMATRGELVVSLARLNRLDPVDEIGATVRVEAGAVTEAVHRHAAPAGLTWPIDFAAKGSSQVGGNIATNAGGVKVIRYGSTRQWVLGLETVLADGKRIRMGGALEKDNAGADLKQLFIGSEGTLGIVTAATLKLVRLPEKLDVFLFAVPDLAGAVRLLIDARRAPFTLTAFEHFTDRCLARVERHRRLSPPFDTRASHYVLLELERAQEAALERWLASLFERGLIADGVQAQSAAQTKELWALRENISESLAATGLPYKNDVALPIARLAPFCAELDRVFQARYPDFEICLFGHLGDGNLHVNVMKPEAMEKEAFFAKTHEADQELFRLVQAHQGSVSAEHGIGLLKKPYLGYTRSAAEIALLRAIKRELDPMGILNPGKVFDG